MPPMRASPGAAPFFAGRAFSGPESFPPKSLAAYGLVAFGEGPTPATRQRFLWACQAFLAGLVSQRDLTRRHIAAAQQMITFWPLDSDELAAKLNDGAVAAECDLLTDHYAVASGQFALRYADAAQGNRGPRLATRRGPLLLAWSPPEKMGQPDAVVLVLDLSTRQTLDEFVDALREWRNRIERNPQLWRPKHHGWSMETVRLEIRHFSNRYGAEILQVIAP